MWLPKSLSQPTNIKSIEAVQSFEGVLTDIENHQDLTVKEKATLNTWVLGLMTDIAKAFGQRNNLPEGYGEVPEFPAQ